LCFGQRTNGADGNELSVEPVPAVPLDADAGADAVIDLAISVFGVVQEASS
jgi:hypothetical protein